MKHKHIINIDLDQWCTITEYANVEGVRLNTLIQRIRRHKQGVKSGEVPEYWDIPELNITLVKRP